MNRFGYLGLCLLSLLCVSQTSADSAPEPVLKDKRVLLLYSYHPSFPTSPKVLAGIRSVFSADEPAIDVEYMDSKRLYDAQSRNNFLTSLSYKLAHRPAYDLVITADDNALDFMLAHGQNLFPGTPTVFLGVNNIAKASRQNRNPTMTGVIEASSFQETLDLIRRIQPTRNQLHVVVDGTTSGQADLHSLLELGGKFGGHPIHVLSLEGLDWQEFSEQLRALSGHDALLLLSAYRDRNGDGKSFSESLALMVENSNVAIYHLWEHGLGEGVLGGVMVSHYEQGRQAALMARQILLGEPASDIPVLDRSPNVPMFDYRQLQRFDVPVTRLPADARVKYRPKTVWDSHRVEIILIVLALATLTTLSFHLARQNRLRTRVSRELSEKSHFLRLLMDTIPDLVWMKDRNGTYLSCNRRFESLFGVNEKDIVGRTDFDFVNEELANFFRKHDLRAIARGEPSINEERLCFASDGHQELLETIKTPVIDRAGKVMGVLGVARDISDRRSAEEKIRLLSQAVDQSPISVIITDTDGRIEYVNCAFEEVSGYSFDEVFGRNLHSLQSGDNAQALRDWEWRELSKGESWEGEIRNRKKNGEILWEYTHISPVSGENGVVTRYLVIKEDITLRKRQQEKILYQAHYDALTALPNRVLALDRLDKLIHHAMRRHNRVGILFIDLDDFKKINDSLGHDVGDSVLVQAAERLKSQVRSEDSIGRLGGDEFIVLLSDLTRPEDAGLVADTLNKSLQQPFLTDGRELMLTASIGIALFPDDGKLPKDLLRKADSAMYSAKRTGRATYAFFTAELNAHITRRFALEEQLHGALERGEFRVFYQPKIDLRNQRIIGVEALLRWHNRLLGDIPPTEFIPVAEHTGGITAIGRFVVETALRETRCWCADPEAEFSLAINLSPRQFRDKQLVSHLLAQLHATQIPPSNIELEITEGVLMEQSGGAEGAIEQLHRHGIRLAMDDFGTGYSSLSYLRRYPFDTLKIDREFTRDITHDQGDRELVFASISMAHGLGLTVVAEGVETREQNDLLYRQGCDIAQGYLYSRPLPLHELEQLLDENREHWRAG